MMMSFAGSECERVLAVSEKLLAFEAEVFPELAVPSDAYAQECVDGSDDAHDSLRLFDYLAVYGRSFEDQLFEGFETVSTGAKYQIVFTAYDNSDVECRAYAVVHDGKELPWGMVLTCQRYIVWSWLVLSARLLIVFACSLMSFAVFAISLAPSAILVFSMLISFARLARVLASFATLFALRDWNRAITAQTTPMAAMMPFIKSMFPIFAILARRLSAMPDLDLTGGRRVYLYHEDELRPGDIAVYAKDFDRHAKTVMVVRAGVHNPTLHEDIDAEGKQILACVGMTAVWCCAVAMTSITSRMALTVSCMACVSWTRTATGVQIRARSCVRSWRRCSADEIRDSRA